MALQFVICAKKIPWKRPIAGHGAKHVTLLVP